MFVMDRCERCKRKQTNKKAQKGDMRGRLPTVEIPSSQGMAATLRNEAISLMEASEG